MGFNSGFKGLKKFPLHLSSFPTLYPFFTLIFFPPTSLLHPSHHLSFDCPTVSRLFLYSTNGTAV